MRPLRLAALACLVAVSWTAPAPAGAETTPPTPRLIVRFAPGTPDRVEAAAHRSAGAASSTALSRLGLDVVELGPGADAAAALAAYRSRPDVVLAEVDTPVRTAAAPNDEIYFLQWNLQPASAQNRGTANWEPVFGQVDGAGVIVAVIDTGLRLGGEDQPANVLMGRDYVDNDDDPTDENGHGTHVAGTIAQRTNNATGVAGLAPGATVLAIRALDAQGGGLASNVLAGINEALVKNAKVINLSLASEQRNNALCAGVQAASEQAVVVAAAGNEGAPDRIDFPAACPGAIAVGAVRQDGGRAAYSNRGAALDLTAPGGEHGGPSCDPARMILQETFDDEGFGYFCEQGTSMAAAHVAGAAALVLQVNGVANVEQVLKTSARDLGPAGPDTSFGAGALDVTQAVGLAPTISGDRYWLTATDGGIFAFGKAGFFGSTGSFVLNQPIVGMAVTPKLAGYWLVATDGGIFAFGDAKFFGSTGNIALNRPIVGMARTASGNGYWLVASDGGIFAFGDAKFFGSTGNIALNKPIVAMAPTASGNGYWLVASDGGVFAFGDAKFFGSTGNIALNKPIVGMARTPTGNGYWMVATDGGIFAFGDAKFFGSTGNIALNRPIVGMAATPSGRGYWLAASDGGIFAFGDAPFLGSAGSVPLNRPVVAIAAR